MSSNSFSTSTPNDRQRVNADGLNTNVASASHILATLRSALPSSLSSLSSANQVPTNSSSHGPLLSNARSSRLSEYVNMLSIPQFNGNNAVSNLTRLVQQQQQQQPNHHRSSGFTRHTNNPSTSGGASVHPSFRSKAVCSLQCRHCGQGICGRGMKAILLSDTRVIFYLNTF
jgi:hypothetical protein